MVSTPPPPPPSPAMALSAARKALGPKFRDPLSISVHFPNKAVEGHEADLHVRVLGVSKATATCEVGGPLWLS